MKAKVIGIINEKGGCGKTTTTLNLARALQLSGKRVVVIDNDPQQSASNWRSRNSNESTFTVVSLANTITQQDLSIFSETDYILIDGCPGLDIDSRLLSTAEYLNDLSIMEEIPKNIRADIKENITKLFGRARRPNAKNTSVIRLADLIILPAKASSQDMQPTQYIISTLIEPRRDIAKKPDYRVLLNQSKQQNTKQEQKHRNNLALSQAEVFKTSIIDREIYKAAYDQGATVLDRRTQDEHAYQEIHNLAAEVMQIIENN